MHIIIWPKRDALCRKFYLRSEISKNVLKCLLASRFFVFKDKIFFFKSMQRFSFKSSISFYRRSCLFTGHARSVFRLFKLSRHQAKKYGSLGQIMGLRKSSF